MIDKYERLWGRTIKIVCEWIEHLKQEFWKRYLVKYLSFEKRLLSIQIIENNARRALRKRYDQNYIKKIQKERKEEIFGFKDLEVMEYYKNIRKIKEHIELEYDEQGNMNFHKHYLDARNIGRKTNYITIQRTQYQEENQQRELDAYEEYNKSLRKLEQKMQEYKEKHKAILEFQILIELEKYQIIVIQINGNIEV
ncbi:unnamed protein product [Paramecium sonneborni]|uniref:Uncharacterized protein n=1 Tax=Paramecium sonneborni TaxID=65129 RepID=A0A8S1R6A5_9CILI|nr:unnamed protein product [Paramecium sonneborni]CAD8122844.1 unnamed protein product [Paramecium sonneborni]